jgi:hypothetical protein
LEEEVKVNPKFISEAFDENFVYYLDTNKSILSQTLDTSENIFLLNVRKIYTNNTYFGVNYTTFTNGVIYHHLKCKDRGYSELVVEDKDAFMSKYKNELVTDPMLDWGGFVLKKQKFNLPETVYFCFSNTSYNHTLIQLLDGSLLRGLYGVQTEIEYQKAKKDFGIAFYNSIPTKQEVIDFMNNKISISTSNHICTVSTNYSSIIVEHASQYGQEWSDIKRRKNHE